MASYGKIYEFVRDSQNGAEIRIVISKKNYVGESSIRPLGRAPLLKRENNGQVFGTSLEIYAECKVDGEFAQFYTSSAYEFMVEVFKNGSRIWSGFISPELYSEPDIAPPYDVQIIATDGLGELRNYEFKNTGAASVYDHLLQLISHTGLSLATTMTSDLRYYDGASVSDAHDILYFRIDLSHEAGSSCYDVLQNLLSSLNASITQFDDRWFIFRESDFIRLASSAGLRAFIPGGNDFLMDVASFGSANTCAWWPIGQLSSVIEPAKNRLTLTSPNIYKGNVLDDSWTLENGASYNESEGAYILPDEGSCITQNLDFEGDEVGYRLALRVSARNVGSGEDDQALGIMIMIEGRGYPGERQYWLVQPASSDRGIGSYMWRTAEGSIEAELAVPSDSDTSADAQDIDIILPLYHYNNRTYIYAKTVEVTIFNPAGIHDIYVYGVSLSKYDQFDGYQANVILDNGAREEGSSIDLSMSDGSMIPPAGNIFMSGIPLLPAADEAITSWGIGLSDGEDYIRLMSKEYSKKIALPRMAYKGILNVPAMPLPVLFHRSGTFYFPRTYTYDLYNDELEVDLISIPSAELSVESIKIAQITEARGVPSSGGSGSGGGIGGGIDLSQYVTKEQLATMWKLDEAGNVYTERPMYSLRQVASGGKGAVGTGGTGTGTVMAVSVNGTTYDSVDGIVTIPDYPTKVSQLDNDKNYATTVQLTADLMSKQDKITADNPLSAELISGLGELAFKDVADLSSDYLPLTGGTISLTSVDSLKLKKTTNALALIGFDGDVDGANASLGWLGFYGVDNPVFRGTDTGLYPLLHSGNYATQIGDYYLKTSGGTISNTHPYLLHINNTSGGDAIIQFNNDTGGIGFSSTDSSMRFFHNGSGYPAIRLVGGKSAPIFRFDSKDYDILHSGNANKADTPWTASNILFPKGTSATWNVYTIGAYKGITVLNAVQAKPEGAPDHYAVGLSVSGYYGFTLASLGAGDVLLYRRKNDTDWRTIAFTDSDITGNAATATNADQLDGKHLTDIMNIGFDNTVDLDTLYSENALIVRYWVFANSSNISNQPWSNSAAQVWTLPGNYNLQIAKFYNSNDIRLRGRSGEGWTNWQRLAFTDSNVASATKLETTRTIWGQSFDGTGNIDGSLYFGQGKAALYAMKPNGTANMIFAQVNPDGKLLLGQQIARNGYDTNIYGNNINFCYGTAGSSSSTAIKINSSGNVTIGSGDFAGTNAKLATLGNVRIYRSTDTNTYLDINFSDVSVYYNGYDSDGYCHYYFQSNGTTRLMINGSTGNVGIGTTNPQYKLDVAGTGHFTGAMTLDSTLTAGATTLDSLTVTGDARLKGSGSYGNVLYFGDGSYCYLHEDTDDHLTIYADNGIAMSDTVVASLEVVNTSYFKGNTTHKAIAYFANGTSYYISAAGAAKFASLTSGAITASGLITANAGATIPQGQKLTIGGATLEWDSASNALKVTGNMYTTGTLASGAKGSTGTVGGALTGDLMPSLNYTYNIGDVNQYYKYAYANSFLSGAPGNNLNLYGGTTSSYGIRFRLTNFTLDSSGNYSNTELGYWKASGLVVSTKLYIGSVDVGAKLADLESRLTAIGG